MTEETEMPCAELVERVTDYLEGALLAADRRRLEQHLAGCTACARYLDQLRETIRLTGQLREADIGDPMRRRLTQIFVAWRRDA